MRSQIISYLNHCKESYIGPSQLDEIYQLLDKEKISIEKQRKILEEIDFHNKMIYSTEQKAFNPSSSLEIATIPESTLLRETSKKALFRKQKNIIDIDISDYIQVLKKCHTMEEILEVLPKKENTNYHSIISKILLYYYQYKVEIINLLNTVENISEEEKKQFKEEENSITNVMETIHDFVIQGTLQEDTMGEIHKNQLLFLQTSNIPRVLHSLNKNIDTEYYESFRELFQSIINGTFKGFRTFTSSNHHFSGIYEVRGFKTRVLFDRIAQNKYVILDAFIKKCDTDLRHQFYIKNVVSLYRTEENEIRDRITSPSFLSQQSAFEKSLFEMLGNSKKKVLKNE